MGTILLVVLIAFMTGDAGEISIMGVVVGCAVLAGFVAFALWAGLDER